MFMCFMARYAALLSVDIPRMYMRNTFEDPIPCDYIETVLNATGINLLIIFYHRTLVMTQYASLLSVDIPWIYL